ncbi:hypothetical protein AV521_32885 [Streptomyces sp. IMTB 2501]|uniref:DUF6232 family protein n=1 Tax=Streptomyces sp. IMTB 2501 TaxID=1776340 RepID=UPI00096D9F9C|nr:DUF6232 family protein [Streptomyces sp. IMTB 2501]OLZ65159.1 hypothetical protein AV521_32885 [Streptomyces sp. IMTB 2501]
MPDIPAPPPHPAPMRLDLRVSKRILWIGAAVYPLHNIARVYSFVLRPKRKEALLRFLRYTAGTLAIGFIAMLPSVPSLTLGGGGEQHSGVAGYVTFIWSAAVVAEIFFLVDMLSVLTASPHHVLAIETSGASTALVTSQDPRQLDQIVGQISYAIDHPDTEFKVTVQSLTVSPKNYYFGDNVNMYGGSGNVGIGA